MSQIPPLDESFPMNHRNSTLLSSLRRSLRRGSSKRKSENKRFINIINPLLHVGMYRCSTIHRPEDYYNKLNLL